MANQNNKNEIPVNSKNSKLSGSIGEKAASGIGESVTPDAQMTPPSHWSFQACGIDTLDLGFFVEWRNWERLEKQLTNGKARAIKAKGLRKLRGRQIGF